MFRVEKLTSWFRVFRIYGFGFWVQGSGSRV
jgi:hypothetical protein